MSNERGWVKRKKKLKTNISLIVYVSGVVLGRERNVYSYMSVSCAHLIKIIIFSFYIALNANVSKRFTNILLPRSLFEYYHHLFHPNISYTASIKKSQIF